MKPFEQHLAHVALAAFASCFAADLLAQALPNPYRLVDDWARFPDGREIGAVGDVDVDVDVDPDGEHVWAVIRCDAEADRFGWEMGIRIGDAAGNLYGGEPRPRKLQKYVRVRP